MPKSHQGIKQNCYLFFRLINNLGRLLLGFLDGFLSSISLRSCCCKSLICNGGSCGSRALAGQRRRARELGAQPLPPHPLVDALSAVTAALSA